MDVNEKVPEKTGGDVPEIPGIGGIPADLSPETLAFFQGLIGTFNETATKLQTAYASLQVKFDTLNLRLEESNRELSESLAEQERLSNYLTNILESLTSGVLVVDKGGIITLFNRGAEIMTGIEVGDAVGRKYKDVIGDDTPYELTPLWVLEHGEARTQMEKTFRSADGGTIPVGVSVSPLRNPAGDLLGAVEIFMDMSRIKALEDEISRMDKLAALGQMSATMAHKIRNPLGGIVGYAGLLDSRLDVDDKSKRHISRIIEGVEKIDHIITSVLEYNRSLVLSPREMSLPVRIDELVAQVKIEFEEPASPAVGFTVSHTDEPLSAEVDPDHLSAALMYILRNAVEAVEDEGSVDIRIIPGHSERVPVCRITAAIIESMRRESRLLQSKRPSVIVTVTDSGCGMDEMTLKNLYVPFYTTKEKGIGLGLPSARKIIEAHHGEIRVESIMGVGTAVGIIIPEKSVRLTQ